MRKGGGGLKRLVKGLVLVWALIALVASPGYSQMVEVGSQGFVVGDVATVLGTVTVREDSVAGISAGDTLRR
ncbi:MAG: hypothetical protein FJY95_19905, partial [Candidatus Handelsmanbacteria bacterium]|nr:hypothetical protein [Candidatus Handelsmanbacteria bacterium]